MKNRQFELTNEQRKYLGLIQVEKNWEVVSLNENTWFYFDGDIIRKQIIVDENSYLEKELNEKTTENRTIILPKTAKGKPKKLNFTATQSFNPFGVYFRLSLNVITIANYTAQITYYSENLGKDKNIEDLKTWLNKWIAETTEKDLKEIEEFKTQERKHCKFTEGDFFAFKIGRRQWGFGRILMDVAKVRKTLNENKNYGLSQLMGKPLIVKVYHKISDTIDINLDELSLTMALPSQAVMDNHFYYGEKIIIGNQPLKPEEYDMLISYGRSKSAKDKETVYLQYGLIYKETTISKFNKYLVSKNPQGYDIASPHNNGAIGFDIDTDTLEECIAQKSNLPFWNAERYLRKHDLRNPANTKIKNEIFKFFGLDSQKSYQENIEISNKVRRWKLF